MKQFRVYTVTVRGRVVWECSECGRTELGDRTHTLELDSVEQDAFVDAVGRLSGSCFPVGWQLLGSKHKPLCHECCSLREQYRAMLRDAEHRGPVRIPFAHED